MDLLEILDDFNKVAELAGLVFLPDMCHIETLKAPHEQPKSLPSGKIAVYIFFWGEKCLKVGKAGPKSNARYTSQHYIPNSSGSNLAKSIVKNQDKLGLEAIDENNVGNWIKTNTKRINIIVAKDAGIYCNALLEVFLHCRLKPIFEGISN